MANVKDISASITISVQQEGFASIQSVTAVPPLIYSGGSSEVTARINNTSVSDTLWVKFYVGTTQVGVTQTSIVTPVAPWYPVQVFSPIYQTTTVTVRAGHILFGGGESPQDSWMNGQINVYSQGQAEFVPGYPQFPSSVESGQDAVITYQVRNAATAGTDRLWGALFQDSTTTTPYVSPVSGATYWEELDVTPGEILYPAPITIPAAVLPITGWEIRIGHYVEP